MLDFLNRGIIWKLLINRVEESVAIVIALTNLVNNISEEDADIDTAGLWDVSYEEFDRLGEWQPTGAAFVSQRWRYG